MYSRLTLWQKDLFDRSKVHQRWKGGFKLYKSDTATYQWQAHAFLSRWTGPVLSALWNFQITPVTKNYLWITTIISGDEGNPLHQVQHKVFWTQMDFKIQRNIYKSICWCQVYKIIMKKQVNKEMCLHPFQNIESSDCSYDRMCMQKVYHQEANLHFRNNPGHLTSVYFLNSGKEDLEWHSADSVES